MTWDLLKMPGSGPLTVDPVRSGYLFYARGPMISKDGGRTWEAFGIEDMQFVQVHPADPRIVYTGNNWSRKLFHSMDGGETWEKRGFEHKFENMIVDPQTLFIRDHQKIQ